jgi:hypothetical protein
MPGSKKWTPNQLSAVTCGSALAIFICMSAAREWPDIRATVVVGSLLLTIFLGVVAAVKFRWVLAEPPEMTISKSLASLSQSQPCNRELLRRCCRCFPQSLALTELAELPTSLPIPPDLLVRASQALPEVWDPLRRRSLVMKVAMILPAALVLLIIFAVLIGWVFRL